MTAFLPVSSHKANAPVPSPKALTTVSCARPQKFMDEKNEPSQSEHACESHVTVVFSSRSRDPHSLHTRMAGMMLLRWT